MNEEVKRMGISVEEIINSIMGTSEKEFFGYEIDSLVMLNKKIALEHEIKQKLFELERDLRNERIEKETIYKLVKKIIDETFGRGNLLSKLEF